MLFQFSAGAFRTGIPAAAKAMSIILSGVKSLGILMFFRCLSASLAPLIQFTPLVTERSATMERSPDSPTGPTNPGMVPTAFSTMESEARPRTSAPRAA
jgi:hypothetical protein